jgi:MFS family permease
MLADHSIDEAAAPADGAPPPGWTTGRRRFALALLSLSAVLNLMDRQALTILIEPIKAEFHLSDTRIGLLAGAAFAICYTLFSFPVARLLDRGPRKTLFAASLALWSLATMATGLATSYAFLLFSRLAVAIGETTASPAQQSLTSDLYMGPNLPRALSLLVAGSAVGSALALVVGGLVGGSLGWRGAFFVVGAPGVLLALLMQFGLREPPRRTVSGADAATLDGRTGRVFAPLWSLHSFRWILLGNGGAGFTGYAILIWTPSLLIRVYHTPIALAGFWLACASGAGITGAALVSGHLSAVLGRKDVRWHLRLSGMGLLLAIPAGLLLAFSPSVGWALLAVFFCHFGNTFFLAPSGTMVMSLAPPRMRGTASTATNLTQTLAGVGLGPLAVGLLNDAFLASRGVGGIRISMAISLVGLAIGGLALLRANRFAAQEYRAATAAAAPA